MYKIQVWWSIHSKLPYMLYMKYWTGQWLQKLLQDGQPASIYTNKILLKNIQIFQEYQFTIRGQCLKQCFEYNVHKFWQSYEYLIDGGNFNNFIFKEFIEFAKIEPPKYNLYCIFFLILFLLLYKMNAIKMRTKKTMLKFANILLA